MRYIKDSNNIVITENSIIKDALKRIDANSEGMLFVINDDLTLIGALSDGDIRRALISGKSLLDGIMGVYNENPYYEFFEEYSEIKTKMIMLEKQYQVIPLVDENKKMIAYVTWNDILSADNRKRDYDPLDLPVVIMAGGKGTRMAPFTNVLPKPLIPIGEKTILEVIIDQFRKHQVKEFYFTINFKGEMIKAYFEGLDKNYSIKYLSEKDFYGTAGSLRLLPKTVAGPFIVTNCDIIVKVDFSDVLEFHRKSGASITIVSSIQHHTVPYGVIKFSNGGRVDELIEKPEYSFCINTGVYIVESECLDLIPENKLFHMTHLIEKVMSLGKIVSTYPVNESEYIDVGQWDEYHKAVSQLSV